jgi:hypothetical protein
MSNRDELLRLLADEGPPDPPLDRSAVIAWRVILCALACFWLAVGAAVLAVLS